MKVKDLVKIISVESNADIFVEMERSLEIVQIYLTKIPISGYIMNFRVNSFSIIDNVLTIYVQK